MIIINNFSRVFHMGCEYCSMSYNVKICQNQQLMCTCCEGDPLHPSAYYRLGFCGRPSVCVRFFSQTHMTYYTHKTDIFSICCHAAVHKPGENQAQNSASKKKKHKHSLLYTKNAFYGLPLPTCPYAFVHKNTCVKSHSSTLSFSLSLLFHTPTHSQKNVQKDTPTQTKHTQDFPVRDGFKRRIGEFFESFQETPHPLFLVTLNCLFVIERDFLPHHYMEYYTENNVIRLNSKFRITL